MNMAKYRLAIALLRAANESSPIFVGHPLSPSKGWS
jgi:hypothetical protein